MDDIQSIQYFCGKRKTVASNPDDVDVGSGANLPVSIEDSNRLYSVYADEIFHVFGYNCLFRQFSSKL